MKFKFQLLFILLGTLCLAQNHFEMDEISKNYRVSIDIATCNEKECFGKTSLNFINKNTSEKLPTLISENFTFNIETDSLNSKKINFEDAKIPLIFDDFNFDGHEDLALINGSSRNADKYLYDIFIYDSIQKQFLLSEGLTDLVKDNSGMFTADAGRKRLVIHSKSGCCIHTTKEYEVIQGRDPLKVYEFEEDTRDPKTVITKKTEFIDYKWLTKTTTYPREVYYKENNDENTKGN
jgi:hypothetical protein